MKKLIIIVVISLCLSLYAKDQITIYNNNFALFKSKLDLNLEKGSQNYALIDVPDKIDQSSLIFTPISKSLTLLNQKSELYEFDQKGSFNIDTLLKRYLDSEVQVTLKTYLTYSGRLANYNDANVLLIDSKTSKTIFVEKKQIESIVSNQTNLSYKKSFNFFLNVLEKGLYSADLSYITYGINYSLCYDAIFNKDKLELTPWVILANNTDKDFKDVSVKILMGNVNINSEESKSNRIYVRGGRANELTKSEVAEMKVATGGYTAEYGSLSEFSNINDDPYFSRSSVYDDPYLSRSSKTSEGKFSDYHVYYLDGNIDLLKNQRLKTKLIDTKEIKSEKKYQYYVFDNYVNSKIEFQNTKEAGLGIPLQKGLIRVYEKDLVDNRLEFIGEQNIDLSLVDKLVTFNIGQTYDVYAKTTVLNEKGNYVTNRKSIKVELENKTDSEIVIQIDHDFYSISWIIDDNNFEYEKNGTRAIRIIQKIPPKGNVILSWNQKVK